MDWNFTTGSGDKADTTIGAIFQNETSLGPSNRSQSSMIVEKTGTDDQLVDDSIQFIDVNVALTVVYLAIFLIGVVGNICNCIVIADSRNKYMKTATNYYLFSLSVSDLLLLIFGLPHDLVNLWHPSPYLFNQFVCVSRGWISEASTNASVLVIVAFTVERYLAICHPLKAHTLSRLSRSVKIIISIWLVASSCALVVVMQYGVIMIPERKSNGQYVKLAQCTTIQRNETIFELSVFVFFIVPMAVITILYVKLGYHLRQKTHLIKQNQLKRRQRMFSEDSQHASQASNSQLSANNCNSGAHPSQICGSQSILSNGPISVNGCADGANAASKVQAPQISHLSNATRRLLALCPCAASVWGEKKAQLRQPKARNDLSLHNTSEDCDLTSDDQEAHRMGAKLDRQCARPAKRKSSPGRIEAPDNGGADGLHHPAGDNLDELRDKPIGEPTLDFCGASRGRLQLERQQHLKRQQRQRQLMSSCSSILDTMKEEDFTVTGPQSNARFCDDNESGIANNQVHLDDRKHLGVGCNLSRMGSTSAEATLNVLASNETPPGPSANVAPSSSTRSLLLLAAADSGSRQTMPTATSSTDRGTATLSGPGPGREFATGSANGRNAFDLSLQTREHRHQTAVTTTKQSPDGIMLKKFYAAEKMTGSCNNISTNQVRSDHVKGSNQTISSDKNTIVSSSIMQKQQHKIKQEHHHHQKPIALNSTVNTANMQSVIKMLGKFTAPVIVGQR